MRCGNRIQSGIITETVRNRIEDYFDTQNADGMSNIHSNDSFSYLALHKLQILLKINGDDGHEAINGAKGTVVLPTVPSDEIYDSSNVWFTINDAVAARISLGEIRRRAELGSV